MPPNASTEGTGVLYETDREVKFDELPEDLMKVKDRKLEILWLNVTLFTFFYATAVYGFYLMVTSAKIATTILLVVCFYLHGLAMGAGAHRLWAHRSYKAKVPLKIFYSFINLLAFEKPLFDWARDHRVHHKFSETDADPHNFKRGFFFAHIGWLMCSKHPEVANKGKTIDISDLLADPVLLFQRRHYWTLMPIVCFGLPTVIPMYFWGETFLNAACVNILRFVLAVNVTMSVNSFAHWRGRKPYDKNINPAEIDILSILSLGEGAHNYHHTFPWDYKTSELGTYSKNLSCKFINLMAKLGLAYDLKSASPEMIKNRVLRTGDGSHDIWGWGDKDQSEKDYQDAEITYKIE